MILTLAGAAAAVPAQAATTQIGAVTEVGAAQAPSSITGGGFAVQVAESAGSYAVPPGYATITSWTHSAGATPGSLTFKVYRPTGTTREFVAVASDLRTIVPDAVQTFAVRIPVQAGDRIGLSSDDVELAYESGDTRDKIGFFGVDLAPGGMRATDGEPFESYKLDVTARLDSASTGTVGGPLPLPSPGTAPAPGQTMPGSPEEEESDAPMLTSLRVAPGAFRAARRGPTVRSSRARGAGAKISLRVSAATKVRFSFRRLRGGRRSGRGSSARCVAATKRNRKAKRCLRAIPLKGKFRRHARTGASSFRFTGNLRGRRLKRGSYRIVATPSPRARGVRAVRASFRVR